MIYKSFDEAVDKITVLADLTQKVCGDKEAFFLIKELFQDTFAVSLWSDTKISPKASMQLAIANGCLRHVQVAILADGEMEDSEIADSWEIVRHLVEYYGDNLADYARFGDMSRNDLLEFLMFHLGDASPYGGSFKTLGIDLNNLDHNSIDILAIEREFPGGCLTACLAALCSKRELFEDYNNIINYVMLRIMSDDKRLQTRGIEKKIECLQYLWSNLLRHRLADHYFTRVEDKYDDPRLIQARKRLLLEFED